MKDSAQRASQVARPVGRASLRPIRELAAANGRRPYKPGWRVAGAASPGDSHERAARAFTPTP